MDGHAAPIAWILGTDPLGGQPWGGGWPQLAVATAGMVDLVDDGLATWADGEVAVMDAWRPTSPTLTQLRNRLIDVSGGHPMTEAQTVDALVHVAWTAVGDDLLGQGVVRRRRAMFSRRPRFEVVDTQLRRDLVRAVRSSFFTDEMPRDHQVAVAALYATGHLEEALSGNGLLDPAVSRRAEERLADDPLASRLHYVASSLVNLVSVTGGVQA